MKDPAAGTVGWFDLTVDNAEQIRDFYSNVVGWQADDHDMGDYTDFNMKLPDSDQIVTGICHARGANAKLPAAWLMYITVANVAASAQKCEALGGRIVDGPRKMGNKMFCVIQDPAGAVSALYGN